MAGATTTGAALVAAALAAAALIAAALIAAALVACPPARADTAYVDGISDRSMPVWDGGFGDSPFARLFAGEWVADGHISYARYAVQWNVMLEPTAGANPAGDYRERLEAWYADASSLGLTLDVALTSYDSSTPATPARYAEALTLLLQALPGVRYVEAWNEPNGSPFLQPRRAAALANAAAAVCRARASCSVIVGDLLDSPAAPAYERFYERYLEPFAPAGWGIHPYYAVGELSEAPVDALERALPARGAGVAVWFTEVGAYYCSDHGGTLDVAGETRQEADAFWLTHLLMPNTHPAHVFYFEFLYGWDSQPPCTPAQADTSLYVPAGGHGTADRPRAAAAMIFGGPLPARSATPAPTPAAAGELSAPAPAGLPF